MPVAPLNANTTPLQPVGTIDGPALRGVALATGLAVLWALIHRYLGITSDGEIYAIQALARLHPYFSNDVYLANTSQDAFTIFSPLYATLIRWMGLIAASTALFAICTVIHLGALWSFARRLFDSRAAYLSVALGICVTLIYGANRIFFSSQDYLTARSLGEAMSIVAIALYVWGRRKSAFGLAAVALLVHPLMACPALLFLMCLSVANRTALLTAIFGLVGATAVCTASALGKAPLPFLRAMDPVWLDTVMERSQFLFYENWRWNDFEPQVGVLVTLAMAYAVLDSPLVRKLCVSAVIVGATGLALGAIAGATGPIPVLLQGQAWRWTWISGTIAVCLVAPCALEAWRHRGLGRLSAVLLAFGWTFVPLDSNLAIGSAFLLWVLRKHLQGSDRLFNVAALGAIAIAACWSLANMWQFVHDTYIVKHAAFDPKAFARATASLQPIALLCVFVWWHLVRHLRKALVLPLLAAIALFAMLLPGSLLSVPGFEAVRDQSAYEDWRSAIPESSSVLLLPSSVSAAFPWFTLQRVSYTSVDQSAGVVFSAQTAAEIRRRSEVLLPVMEPNWRILSQNRRIHAHRSTPNEPTLPLTAQSLTEICRDPQLGFVIAEQDVGFSPVRHTGAGQYKNWNLYDCRIVRSSGPRT